MSATPLSLDALFSSLPDFSNIKVKSACLKRLGAIDKALLDIESPEQLMTIAGAWVFEDSPAEADIVAAVHNWVGEFPAFRARLNGLRWEEDPDFKISNHLTVTRLPSPGGKKELEEYLSVLMSQPFDMSRPLWQSSFIRGFKGEGSVYFVRLHHCISDGQGTIRMVLSLTSNSEEEKIAGAGHTAQPKSAAAITPSTPAALSQRAQKQKLVEGKIKQHTPFGLGDLLLSFLLAIRFFPVLFLFLGLLQFFLFRLVATFHALTKYAHFIVLPKKVFAKKGGVKKQVAYSDLLDLEEAKKIGRACNATLNDVLVSNLASSIRSYLKSTGELNLQKEIACLVPVSMRRHDDWQLGNKVTTTLLQLPIHIEDPLERLRVVKTRLDELKVSNEIPIAYFGTRFGVNFLPRVIIDFFVQLFINRYHVLLTNVPGPRQQLNFAGKPIKEYHSFVPQPSQGGLGMCVLSYNGKVSLSINTDAGHLTPHCGSLLGEFKKEFEVLKEAVAAKYPLSPAPTAAAPVLTKPVLEELPAATETEDVADSKTKRRLQVDSGFNSENGSDSD